MAVEVSQNLTQVTISSVGLAGANGTSGTSGVSGANGTDGIDGIDGLDGTNGVNGTSGIDGTSGLDGTNGTGGTSGVDGTSGINGTSGVDGTSGFSIDSGSFATTGSNTFVGDQTISGSLFISGATEFGGDLVPKTARGATLGTKERPFREIYVQSGSINIASDMPGDPNTTLSNIGGNILVSAGGMRLVESGNSFIAETGSFQFISGSMTQVGDYTQTGDYVMVGDKTITGSLNISGSIILENGAVIKDNENNSISFGYLAAETNQGTQSVAIGNGAGYTNQSNGAVALGTNAGAINQGQRALALGSLAGSNTQGEYAIAIGNFAGPNNQANNSIVISATGTGLDNTTPNSLVIAPIRNVNGNDGLLQYNNTTKEVSYSNQFTGSLVVTGSFEVVGSVTASKVLTDLVRFNTSAGVSVGVGELAWNNSDGTLDLGMKGGAVVQQIGQEIFYEVRNETGIQIPNGTAVFANGVTAGSGRITAAPYTADGSVREVRFLGLATENISTGINGFVTYFGYVRGLDTRGNVVSSIAVGDETWAVGDILYVHPTIAGKLTNVKPEHAITVAIIITRHQSVGVLFVRPSSGGHLEDIHDILINTGSLTNGQVLSYNSTSGLWENTNQINTSSFATTGSNTFVGNQIVSGTLNIATNSGDEGGEIQLGKAVTNTTIAGNNVVVDVFRDRVRIFEDGGSSRGAFLNVVSQSAGVGSEIVTSPNIFSIQTISSASYAALNPPVSGTLYIII